MKTIKQESQALTLRIPKEEHEALRAFAFHAGQSVNEVVLSSIRQYLTADGRSEEFESLLDKARTQYRVALDKLKDL